MTSVMIVIAIFIFWNEIWFLDKCLYKNSRVIS